MYLCIVASDKKKFHRERAGIGLGCQQAAKVLLRAEEREGECGLQLGCLFGWAKRAEKKRKNFSFSGFCKTDPTV
jgi:hypothetical protein